MVAEIKPLSPMLAIYAKQALQHKSFLTKFQKAMELTAKIHNIQFQATLTHLVYHDHGDTIDLPRIINPKEQEKPGVFGKSYFVFTAVIFLNPEFQTDEIVGVVILIAPLGLIWLCAIYTYSKAKIKKLETPEWTYITLFTLHSWGMFNHVACLLS